MFRRYRLSTTKPFLYFPLFYLAAVFCVRKISSHDPTSFFFNPAKAYTPSYSTLRQGEAETFILAASKPHLAHNAVTHEPVTPKKLCAGIPSIARDGVSYLQTSVGSLLHSLTPEERGEIYFIAFLPHTDPTTHPAFSEYWLSNLTDNVLTYDLPDDKISYIAQLEKDAGLFREKGLFDYTYLLQACYRTGAPYIAVFEDDIVAMDGWYHRTIAGLEAIETKTALETASWDFLYLRLFYTEEFLGWNKENWPIYLSWSLFVTSISTVALFLARDAFLPPRKSLPTSLMLTLCILYISLLILLFFAAGRATVLPLSKGVNKMNKYGCCSQGLVFPREKARVLYEWFETKKLGFVDMLIEEYADQHHELRWALTPSVLQHIGRKSSKGDDFGAASKYSMTVAEKLWNFAFERYNAIELQQEHLKAT